MVNLYVYKVRGNEFKAWLSDPTELNKDQQELLGNKANFELEVIGEFTAWSSQDDSDIDSIDSIWVENMFELDLSQVNISSLKEQLHDQLDHRYFEEENY